MAALKKTQGAATAAERLSFDVRTLRLFVCERLSTKSIFETLMAHEKEAQESSIEMSTELLHA
ncbi:MAG: hypothetical protein JWM95_1404 [Gemmatimonadetes bacterium]|nr:hypothetical protein [Gemmatimonadota bacterium]